MTVTVDLNADLGESFGRWVLGDDAAMLDVVTSANVACGFHPAGCRERPPAMIVKDRPSDGRKAFTIMTPWGGPGVA